MNNPTKHDIIKLLLRLKIEELNKLVEEAFESGIDVSYKMSKRPQYIGDVSYPGINFLTIQVVELENKQEK